MSEYFNESNVTTQGRLAQTLISPKAREDSLDKIVCVRVYEQTWNLVFWELLSVLQEQYLQARVCYAEGLNWKPSFGH